jgi:hypothetical protein
MDGFVMSDVIYLYGFVPLDVPLPPEGLRGPGGGRVELLPAGDVAAAVSRLPEDTWGGDAVEARIEDLAWVGEQGLAHERVVLWFVDHGDILPARLFSLYSDEDALRAAMEPRRVALREGLARLGGRREWNLKVAYDAAELARHGGEISESVRQLDEEIRAAPPGRRYLMQRQRAELLKREVAHSARRLAAGLLDGLRPLAEAAQVLPLAAGDEGGAVCLSAALLVGRDGEAALRQEADRRIAELAALGMRITFSGPWAPYRFLEGEAAADA